MSLFYCDICEKRVKTTKKLTRAKELDSEYVLICIICRSNAKEMIKDDFRCISVRMPPAKEKKCQAFRFTHKHGYCRYHWGKMNEGKE